MSLPLARTLLSIAAALALPETAVRAASPAAGARAAQGSPPKPARPKKERSIFDGPEMLPQVPAGTTANRPNDVAAAEAQLASVDQLEVLVALDVLAQSGDAGIDALERAMEHANGYVSVAATLTLGGLGEAALPKLRMLFDNARAHSLLDHAHTAEARQEFVTLVESLRKAALELHETEGGAKPAPQLGWDLPYAERVAAIEALALVGAHDPKRMLDLYAKESDTEGPALASYHDLRLAVALACFEQREAWSESVLAALESENASVRIAALDAAGCAWIKARGALPARALAAIQKSLGSKLAAERAHAIECTSAIQIKAATLRPLLEPLLADADPLVRLQAARVLRNYVTNVEAAEPVVVAALSDASPRIRRAALLSFHSGVAAFETLGEQPPPPAAALARVIELLNDPDVDVCVSTLLTLPRYVLAAEPALPKMRAFLESDNDYVRSQAEFAIEKLERKIAEAKAAEGGGPK